MEDRVAREAGAFSDQQRFDDHHCMFEWVAGGKRRRGHSAAILLTENAQPGQKFVIAVRADAGGRQTPIYGRRLHLEAPTNRPNPNILGEEILSAQPMVVSVSHLTHQIEIAGGSGHSATILVLVATRRPALPAAGTAISLRLFGSNTLIPPGGERCTLQFHLKIERDDCNSLDYDNECGGGFRVPNYSFALYSHAGENSLPVRS